MAPGSLDGVSEPGGGGAPSDRHGEHHGVAAVVETAAEDDVAAVLRPGGTRPAVPGRSHRGRQVSPPDHGARVEGCATARGRWRVERAEGDHGPTGGAGRAVGGVSAGRVEHPAHPGADRSAVRRAGVVEHAGGQHRRHGAETQQRQPDRSVCPALHDANPPVVDGVCGGLVSAQLRRIVVMTGSAMMCARSQELVSIAMVCSHRV